MNRFICHPDLSVDIKEFDVRDRNAYWVDIICKHFVEVESDPGRHAQLLTGEIYSQKLGSVVVAEAYADAQRFIRTKSQIASSSDAPYQVFINFSGDSYFSAEHVSSFKPGDILIVDTSRVFEWSLGKNTGHLIFNIPRQYGESVLSNLEDFSGFRLKADLTPVTWINRFVFDVLRSEGAKKSRPNLTFFSEQVIRYIFSLAKNIRAGSMSSDVALQSDSKIQIIRDFISQNIHCTNLSAAMVAERLGFSRRTLYNICEKNGLSPAQIILKTRLHYFKSLLDCPSKKHMSITELSYAAGFSNPSYASRVFKEDLDVSPKEYRARSSKTGG